MHRKGRECSCATAGKGINRTKEKCHTGKTQIKLEPTGRDCAPDVRID